MGMPSKIILTMFTDLQCSLVHPNMVTGERKKFRAILPSSLLQFSCMKEERGTEINHGPLLSRRIILEAGPKCNNSSMLFACKVAIFHNISGH